VCDYNSVVDYKFTEIRVRGRTDIMAAKGIAMIAVVVFGLQQQPLHYEEARAAREAEAAAQIAKADFMEYSGWVWMQQKMNVEEFVSYLQAQMLEVSSEKAQNLFASHDSDKDSYISDLEFRHLRQAAIEVDADDFIQLEEHHRQLSKAHFIQYAGRKWWEVFQYMDWQEFCIYLDAKEQELEDMNTTQKGDQKAQDLFSMHDYNKDKYLSKNEFVGFRRTAIKVKWDRQSRTKLRAAMTSQVKALTLRERKNKLFSYCHGVVSFVCDFALFLLRFLLFLILSLLYLLLSLCFK